MVMQRIANPYTGSKPWVGSIPTPSARNCFEKATEFVAFFVFDKTVFIWFVPDFNLLWVIQRGGTFLGDETAIDGLREGQYVLFVKPVCPKTQSFPPEQNRRENAKKKRIGGLRLIKNILSHQEDAV